MRIRTLTSCLVGVTALSALLSLGGCASDNGARSSASARPNNNAFLTGDSLWTRKHVDTGRGAPMPRATDEEPPVSSEELYTRSDDNNRTRNTGRTGDCTPDVGPNETVVSQAFPTGELNSSAIVVHTVMPREVRVNQDYQYELQVCNLTGGTLENVVVTHENQNNFNLVSSNPSSSEGANGTRQWVLGSLGPNATETILVTGRASSAGISSNCVGVSYNNLLCAETRVVEPALALRKTATPEVLLCDTIEIKYTVTNTGTGACDNVVVTDALPAGLTTADGKTGVRFNAGTIGAGQSKDFVVQAKANRTGRFSSAATATSDCGADASAAATTTIVRQPKLAITSDCVERVFIGRNVDFTFNLANSGDAACENTTVSATVPSGAEFVSASNGGTLQGGRVVWNAGTVSADGGTRSLTMTVRPTGAGTLSSRAEANCVCAAEGPVNTTCEVSVEGIPAILLEVVDSPDPIRVGESVTYTITVTNQGSATANQIRVVCSIPDEMTFVSAAGATNGSNTGQNVTFAPLPTLAPKASATFRVTVRANAAGNVRFGTSMTSQVFQRPIEETEATYLYE